MNRTLVIADIHLTDQFDQKLFNYLSKLFANYDQIIINGDLWEGWLINFDQFINSEWNKLFPLLKEKNTIYLWGNHDPEDLIDERYELFADELLESYNLVHPNKEIILTHGHQLIDINKLPRHVKWYYKALELSENYSPRMIDRFTRRRILSIEVLLFKYLGIRAITKSSVPPKLNQLIKDDIKQKAVADNTYYITSHTHLSSMEPHNNFYNTGFINHGYANYIEILDGAIHICTGSF